MKKLTTQQTQLPQGAYTTLEELQQLRHPAKQLTTSTKVASHATLSGHHKSRAVNRGMEFEEVRQYQAGDDIRNIDWRVTARTQITHTKRYSEEKEKPLITAVDQRHSLFFGSHPCFKSVYACHLAALINWATILQGDRSGGIVLSDDRIAETRPARSHKTVNRWLHQLSTANQQLSSTSITQSQTQHTRSLADLLQQLLQSTPTGTGVYIISDFYDLDEACEKLLFQLSKHRNITLLWVLDQLEQQLPSSAPLAVSNGQNSLTLNMSQTAQEAFHKQFIDKKQDIEALSQRLNIGLKIMPVQIPPLDNLLSLN